MITSQKLKKTQLGIELIRRIAAEGDRIFSTARAREVAPEVGLKESYLSEALYHLRRNGWIVSLRRGLHALSASVPGVIPAHEFEVAMALVNPAAISHWSALHYHGLTDQAPRKVFILTTTEAFVPRVRSSKARGTTHGYPVGDVIYQFVQVKPARYFGTEEQWIREARVTITDPERTLLDGLSIPQYCGDFAEVLHAFGVRGDDLDLDRIIDYACKLDVATAKRLGWVLELHGVAPDRLEPLLKFPIKGYRKLDPTGPRKGPCSRRWMIQENLPGKVKA
jgi:predicted transcriptional regulator of viral defense system